MAKKRKRKSGRRRRKSLRGLRGRSKLKGAARELVPPLAGATLSLGTTLGLRAYLRPTPGTAAEAVYRHAPWIGVGAGMLGGGLMYMLGGKTAGLSTALTAAVTGGALFAVERLHAAKPGAFIAIGGGGALPSGGADGLRAVVPEYAGGPFATGTDGLSAIVMERLKGNQQNQGANVDLRGTVNMRAFGNRPFGS